MLRPPKIIISILLIFLLVGIGKTQCPIETQAFKYGEKLTYEVTYNWGIVWVKAGKVTFETDTKRIKNKTYFLFNGIGRSYSFYDWFYKVRDNYTSYTDPETLLPLEFQRNTSEGNYKVNNSYFFDRESKIIISKIENSNKISTTDTLNLEPCIFDVLSAVYYTRSIDFSTKMPRDTVIINIIIDGGFYNIPITYLGKGVIQNRDGSTYRCIKFSAKLVAGTIFKAGKEIYVYVTDDKNKIPIMVEASILVGSVKAYLLEYQGLKYKLTSLIK